MIEIIDWWAIPHLAFFIFVASGIDAAWSPKNWVHILWGLLLSYGWETVEYFLQRTYTEAWSNHVESAVNSWVVDPISNMLGVLIGVAIARWSKRRWGGK